jgi:hypothetical protein
MREAGRKRQRNALESSVLRRFCARARHPGACSCVLTDGRQRGTGGGVASLTPSSTHAAPCGAAWAQSLSQSLSLSLGAKGKRGRLLQTPAAMNNAQRRMRKHARLSARSVACTAHRHGADRNADPAPQVAPHSLGRCGPRQCGGARTGRQGANQAAGASVQRQRPMPIRKGPRTGSRLAPKRPPPRARRAWRNAAGGRRLGGPCAYWPAPGGLPICEGASGTGRKGRGWRPRCCSRKAWGKAEGGGYRRT